MKAAQDILLKLIRISLWGPGREEFTSMPEWEKVLMLAKQQTVLGLVADAIPHLPEEFRPDPKITNKLHATVINIYRSHSLLNRKIAELKGCLDSHDIRCVLFKGQGASLNYPKPLCRQCGDIDMYVGDRNFEKALRILKPESDDDASNYKRLKHFSIEKDGVDIEVHRIAEVIPGRKMNRLFQEWTVRHLEGNDLHVVEIESAAVNLPPHQFNALYIMNHAWHHFMNGGIGLRQLCDWTMFLHRRHADIDHKTLEKDLKAFGLIRAWHILAGIAVEHLGLPAEECPLYSGKSNSKSLLMLDVICNEGNFGFYSSGRKQRPAGHFAGKFHSFRVTSRRIRKVLIISPIDIVRSWITYFINGMRNVFVRIK